uniref:NADH-ubiquinone oxidoreductase chain 4L n=1 Tax=Spathoderma clenchi TaxID=1638910 RepID=A0A343YND1_9MOLL|nr:NADH dehydrogenase subunit 4L [Spathoderma clenchi]
MSVFLLAASLTAFTLHTKYLLMMLLSLESAVLGAFIGLMSSLGLTTNELIQGLTLLCFTACEGAIGLALLVLVMRAHGSDYVKSMSSAAF